MREMPYIQPYHVGNRRGGNQNILDEFREFLDARGGRGSHGGRGGMRNRIGYDTYDTYGRPTNKNDREEKILTMLMSSGYNDDGYHFDEYEAKEVVEQMYHVKDNKKYIGEKYDMNKAIRPYQDKLIQCEMKRCLRLVSTILIERLVMLSMV